MPDRTVPVTLGAGLGAVSSALIGGALTLFGHGAGARIGAQLLSARGLGLGAIVGAAAGAGLYEINSRIPNRPGEVLLRRDVVTTAADAGAPYHVTFSAHLPHTDWAHAKPGADVQVLVDGKPVADSIIMSERTTPYDVLVGPLDSGPHTIELQARRDVPGLTASPVLIRSIDIAPSTGDQALVDRYAPIIHGRGCDDMGNPSSSGTDAPLLMSPKITSNADGTRTIEYRVLFSNEDGGTPTPDLLRDWGRTTDYEWAYRLRVDAAGNKIDGTEQYQGTGHSTESLQHGHVGERPVLYVASRNNNFSSGGGDSSVVFSQAPSLTATGITDGLEAMLTQPWTFQVALHEMQREHKISAGDAVDVRHMLFITRAKSWPPVVELKLFGGRTVQMEIPAESRSRPGASAVPLPDGVTTDAIVGVIGAPTAAAVADRDLMPRIFTPPPTPSPATVTDRAPR